MDNIVGVIQIAAYILMGLALTFGVGFGLYAWFIRKNRMKGS